MIRSLLIAIFGPRVIAPDKIERPPYPRQTTADILTFNEWRRRKRLREAHERIGRSYTEEVPMKN